MHFVDLCNRLAEFWSQYMHNALIHGSIALIIAALLWFFIRKKASVQFGYALFLLVLLKFVVHVEIPVPTWRTGASLLNIQTSTQSTILSDDRQITTHGEQQNANPHHDQSAPTDATMSSMQSISPPTEKSSPALEQISAGRESTLTLQSWLMILWLLIVMTLLGGYVKSQKRMRDMVRLSRGLDPHGLPFDWDRLKKNLRIRKSVRLLTNSSAYVPVVVGVFNPRIILPQDFFKRHTPNQMQWILSHELAHIRRNDLAVSFVQRILQIIYFFHPAVWITNRIAAQLREYACDDIGLAVCKGNRGEYGEGLINLVEQMNGHSTSTLLPLGIINNKTLIRRRILRIMDPQRHIYTSLSASSILMLTFLTIFIIPTFSTYESNKEIAQEYVLSSIEKENTEDPTLKEVNSSSMILRKIPAESDNQIVLGNITSDGKFGVGTDWNTGDLILKNYDTGKIKKITDKGSWDNSGDYADECVISPNDKAISYQWYNSDDDNYEIRLINIDGSNDRLLCELNDYGGISGLRWANKTQLFAYSRNSGTATFILIDVVTGVKKVLYLKDTNTFISNKVISPDCKYIAFDFPYKNPRNIYVYSIDKKEETCLIDHPANDHLIGWSPDGKWIVFTSDRLGENGGLWRIQFNNGDTVGEPVLISLHDKQRYYNNISLVGNLIFHEKSIISDIYIASMDFNTGKLFEQPKSITESLPFSRKQDGFWSPNGNFLTFGCSSQNQHQIQFLYSLYDNSIEEIPFAELVLGGGLFWYDNNHFIGKWSPTNSLNKKSQHYKINIHSGEKESLLSDSDNVNLTFLGYNNETKKFIILREQNENNYIEIIERDLYPFTAYKSN